MSPPSESCPVFREAYAQAEDLDSLHVTSIHFFLALHRSAEFGGAARAEWRDAGLPVEELIRLATEASVFLLETCGEKAPEVSPETQEILETAGWNGGDGRLDERILAREIFTHPRSSMNLIALHAMHGQPLPETAPGAWQAALFQRMRVPEHIRMGDPEREFGSTPALREILDQIARAAVLRARFPDALFALGVMLSLQPPGLERAAPLLAKLIGTGEAVMEAARQRRSDPLHLWPEVSAEPDLLEACRQAVTIAAASGESADAGHLAEAIARNIPTSLLTFLIDRIIPHDVAKIAAVAELKETAAVLQAWQSGRWTFPAASIPALTAALRSLGTLHRAESLFLSCTNLSLQSFLSELELWKQREEKRLELLILPAREKGLLALRQRSRLRKLHQTLGQVPGAVRNSGSSFWAAPRDQPTLNRRWFRGPPAGRVRLLRDEDIPECLAICRRLEDNLQIPVESDWPFQARLQQPEVLRLVIESDGQVRGCGFLDLYPGRLSAQLSYGLIHADHQRQGYGRTLMAARLYAGCLAGAKSFRLTSISGSREVWEAMGVEWITTIPGPYDCWTGHVRLTPDDAAFLKQWLGPLAAEIEALPKADWVPPAQRAADGAAGGIR